MPKSTEIPGAEGHRPQLDGLRFLAFFSVFAFHSYERQLPQGALGVALFFCLSGYLITRILIQNGGSPGGLKIFIIRRALRIFPLYFAALAVLIIAGRTSHAASFGVFLGNLDVFWRDRWEHGLIAHFWTLSVEEQFYLILPLAILGAARRIQGPLLGGLLLASMAWVAACGHWWPERALPFTSTPHYGQFILWGACFGFASLRRPELFASARAFCGAGAALVAAGLILTGAGVLRTYTNPFYVIHGVGFSAIVAGLWHMDANLLTRLLGHPAVAYLGKISFGLYVFHAPYLSECRRLFGTAAPAVALALTVLTAHLSWRWLEAPLLRLRPPFRRPGARRRLAVWNVNLAPEWGGSEWLWIELARYAQSIDAELLIHSYRPNTLPPAAVWLDRAPFIRWKRRSLASSLMRRFGLFNPLDLLETLAFRAEVVLINQGGTYDCTRHSALLALRMLTKYGTPYTFLCHSNKEIEVPTMKTVRRAQEIFQNARAVGVVSPRGAALIERQIAQRLPNAFVFRSPLNLTDWSMQPWPESGTTRFACVCRLDIGVKGLDVLLEVFSQKVWADRDWKLTVYGMGDGRELLGKMTRHFGLEGRVTYEGFIYNASLAWQKEHIMVMPSRTEGGPLALLEAMISGRPVVATDVGTIREWITHGHDGFIAAAPTLSALGDALEEAWAERDRWQEMGANGHERALRIVSREPGRELFEALILAPPRPGHPASDAALPPQAS